MNNNNQRVDLISNKGERFYYFHGENSRLGGGAMGEVFEGRSVEDPRRKVAIKRVYPRHAENPELRKRARFEASLCIEHPNLIKMLGYCEFDRVKGPMFIVSELVQGNTIIKFVQTIDLHNRTEVVSRMICSALDALSCLHSQEPAIWHRDIKPTNIMIENGRNVRIMDLGIAATDGKSLGTLTGSGFGTYKYAPPEQILGQRDNVNGTSDIYSLGVTFYELLTNENPFDGPSDIQIMEKQLTLSLPENDLIPKPLFKVLLKATAKKQAQRYQKSSDFKDAIIKVIEDKKDPMPWNLIIIGISALVLILLLIAIFVK